MSKYVWLLFALAALLLVYSASSTSLHIIGPADLGLISELPLTFWAGMVLLDCLWYLCRDSDKGQVASLLLTVCFLYIVPAVIRTPVWLSASYYPFGESALVRQTGHLIYRSTSTLLSYHSWPGFLYLASIITILTGLPDYLLLKIFPMFTIAMYGLLVFLILRVKLKFSYAIIGAAMFLGSFFLRQYYFGPAAIAYIFFLLALLVISRLYFSDKASVFARTLEALFLIITIAITFTHALTSLILLAVIFALYLSQKLGQKRLPTVTARLCLLTATIVLFYMTYSTFTFFKVTLKLFLDIVSGGRPIGIYLEPSRILGSSANRLSYWSYWSIVILNVAVAGLAIIQLFRSVRSQKKASDHAYAFFCMAVLIVTGLFAFTGEYGPHEASQRAFMFGLVPLTYLCVNLLISKPRILLAILVVLLFVNLPAQYGGDSYTLATSTELAGACFFAKFAPQNITCFDELPLYVRYFDPKKNIDFINIGNLPFTSFPEASYVNERMQESDYITVSEIQHNYYVYFLGKNPLKVVDFSRFNRIYDSQSFRTFEHANTASPL